MRSKTRNPGLIVPSSDDPVALADWAEAMMLIQDTVRLSRTRLRRELKSLLFVGEGTGAEDLEPSDLEVALDCVALEVTRRRKMCARTYPYQESVTGIGFDSTADGLPYIFMLCVCVSPTMRLEKRHKEVDREFDLLVHETLKSYLGPGSEARRFGWPPSDGRPKAFPAALQWIARELGLTVGPGKARTASKDGGVDVVAWRPFSDSRSGFITVLAQCTIRVDWMPKTKDIITDAWRGWIDFGKDPVTCLAVPYAVPMDFEQWDELRRAVGIVLDRLRIASLVRDVPIGLSGLLWTWTAKELSRMGATELTMVQPWNPT